MAHIVALNNADADYAKELIQRAIDYIFENYSGTSEDAALTINGLLLLRDQIEVDFSKAYQ